jgi:hypothetical protein
MKRVTIGLGLLTINKYLLMVDLMTKEKYSNILVNILTGKIFKTLIPVEILLIYTVWQQLDILEKEVKICLNMIDSALNKNP